MSSHETTSPSNPQQPELPLMEALVDEELAIRDQVPQSVIDTLHDRAIEENGLREHGYRPERIDYILSRTRGSALPRLALSGVDTSGAFPTRASEHVAPVRELRRSISQEEYDRLVDDAVDKQNIDYTTAAALLDQKYYVK